MHQVAPHVSILDVYTPTERYIDMSTSNRDPFRPACKSMERHLTCPFLDVNFQIAMDSPFYILPPGRLAGAAMLHLLQVRGEEKVENSNTGAACDSIMAATSKPTMTGVICELS